MSDYISGGTSWPEATARAVWRARMERLVQELMERPEEPHGRWLLERVEAKMVNERVKWMLQSQTKRQKKRNEKRMVDNLMKISGSVVNLVPDTLLIAKELLNNHVPSQQAYTTVHEVRSAVDWLVCDPLFTALQAGDPDYTAQCPYCQPDRPFRIPYLNMSGSSAEGLEDGVIGKGGTSDFDIMHEIGSTFSWAARPVGTEPPATIRPQAAPQLWAKPTRNAGFVTLHWVPTTQCSHEAPLGALPADSVRRLMERHCRILRPGKITVAGPATNNVWSGSTTEGGVDHVPCLRLPGWWPAQEDFVNRHREADFPPTEARDDMLKFGVHLVPTGRPGSETEAIEWRVSLSRAEIVAAYNLNAVQHATVTTVKQMKNILEKNRMTSTDKNCTLKSYFIKTAVLWLVQDKPSGSWAGVCDGVRWVLDWLEHHLSTGTLPCFFWDEINIVAELKQVQLHAIISTVQLMRRQINRLLMTCCLNWIRLGILLEDGTGPLTESQLRNRLVRLLVQVAVVNGTIYRPDAPCWEHWMYWAVPVLAQASQDRLFQWCLRTKSGAYHQQCRLLQAWAVIDSDDLMDGVGTASLQGDVVILDVTPLVSLLTEADLVHLLGDPAAVAAWCRRQLRRPPAERPAGLTAELDTPRGRAELLLQPELLLRAIREAVPWKLNHWESADREINEDWNNVFRPPHTFQQRKEVLERLLHSDLEAWLRDDLPAEDGLPIAATARLWRQQMQLLLSGDRLRTAYEAARTRWPDRWQLLPYVVQEHTLEESASSDNGRTIGGEERRGADEERRGTDEERRGTDEERRGADVERRGADEERRGTDVERRGADEERRGIDQELRGTDEERRGADEERRGADEERRGAVKERRGADEERRGADEERRQLREWQVLERQSMDQRHVHERRSMDQRHLEERRSMDQRHTGERRSMGQRHLEERRIVEQR